MALDQALIGIVPGHVTGFFKRLGKIVQQKASSDFTHYMTKESCPSLVLCYNLKQNFLALHAQRSNRIKAGGAMSILEHLLHSDILRVVFLILGLAPLV